MYDTLLYYFYLIFFIVIVFFAGHFFSWYIVRYHTIESFDFEKFFATTNLLKYPLFALISFGVFYRVPPKDFSRVAMATLVIFTIGNFPVFGMGLKQGAKNLFWLSGVIFFPWILSKIWEKIAFTQRR